MSMRSVLNSWAMVFLVHDGLLGQDEELDQHWQTDLSLLCMLHFMIYRL